MRKFVAWGWGLGVLLLILSGCTSFEVETRLNADGSGTRRVSVAVDERAYQVFRQQQVDPLTQLRDLAEEMGARVEPYQATGKVGLRVAMEFGTLDELMGASDATAAEQISIEQEEGIFSTLYRYEARLDSSQFDVTTLLEMGPQLGGVELRYVLQLPGSILEHNATERHGNQLTWVLDPVTRAHYDLYAVYSLPNMRNVWIAMGAGAVAVAVLLVLIVLWLRRSIRGF